MIEKAVIDRFEGMIAVLLLGDGSRRVEVLRDKLPPEAQPGVWLVVDLDGEVVRNITIDLDETKRREQRIASKLDKLRRSQRRNASD